MSFERVKATFEGSRRLSIVCLVYRGVVGLLFLAFFTCTLMRRNSALSIPMNNTTNQYIHTFSRPFLPSRQRVLSIYLPTPVRKLR